MNEIKDGGSAFPRAGNEWEEMSWVPAAAEKGMTLRDYFAAQAMQGLLTAEIVGDYSNDHVANIAYLIADAMLKKREETNE